MTRLGLTTALATTTMTRSSFSRKGSIPSSTAQESSLLVFGQSFYAGCCIGFGALLAVITSCAFPGPTDATATYAENSGTKSFSFTAFLFIPFVVPIFNVFWKNWIPATLGNFVGPGPLPEQVLQDLGRE